MEHSNGETSPGGKTSEAKHLKRGKCPKGEMSEWQTVLLILMHWIPVIPSMSENSSGTLSRSALLSFDNAAENAVVQLNGNNKKLALNTLHGYD